MKNGNQTLRALKHTFKSYIWEKLTEMYFWRYNNITLVLNIVKIQVV